MARRTIVDVNKELNFLEVAYQRLNIKTVDYLEERAKLLEEKVELAELSDAELIKLEREAPRQKESKLIRKLSNPNGGKDLPQPLVFADEKVDFVHAR